MYTAHLSQLHGKHLGSQQGNDAQYSSVGISDPKQIRTKDK